MVSGGGGFGASGLAGERALACGGDAGPRGGPSGEGRRAVGLGHEERRRKAARFRV